VRSKSPRALTFSQVLSVVPLCSKYTRALTFQMLQCSSIEASEQGARFGFLFYFAFFLCFLHFIDSNEASEQGARVECLEPPGQCPCLQLREIFLSFYFGMKLVR
jgi:hypothetical protein